MRTIVGGKGGGDSDVVMAVKATPPTASRTATATTNFPSTTAAANSVQATSTTSRVHCDKRSSRRSRLMMAHNPTRRYHLQVMQQE
jgi:hypothetical protein